MIGEEAALKLESVSLSNNTVKNRMVEMSVDIADQLISGVKDSKFGFFHSIARTGMRIKQCSVTCVCLLCTRQCCEN